MDTATLLAAEQRAERRMFLLMVGIVVLLAPLVVWASATGGEKYVLSLVVVAIVLAVILRKPIVGLYLIMVCVTVVDQAALPTPILTDTLTIYYWPPGLTGLAERPISFLLLLVLLVWMCHRFMKHQRVLWGGPLLWPFLVFLLWVVWGIVHGLTSGGTLKIIVLEIRPLWYLFVAYLLTYNLITKKEQVRSLLWVLIVGAGIKGLQGTYIYLIAYHGSLVGHHEIMSHEESFFFIAVVLLLVILCLHYRYRPQIIGLCLILPPVLLATLANQRRADYLALLIGIMVAWMLIYLVKPKARTRLVVLLIASLVLGGGYVLAFSHASGTLASPARAVISVFAPAADDTTSESSNAYRVIENTDLLFTLKQNPFLGWGFGKPFLQPTPLPDIGSLDPYFNYVPHNTIYWVWMRLGDIGYIAFWYLIGAMIVRGCMVVRRLRDRYLQAVAIFIVATTVMEIIVAYADYQLFFLRNVLYLGLLTGLLLKLPALDEAPTLHKKKEQPADETRDGVRSRTAPKVGGQRPQLLPAQGAGA
jgi:hypothetical protein